MHIQKLTLDNNNLIFMISASTVNAADRHITSGRLDYETVAWGGRSVAWGGAVATGGGSMMSVHRRGDIDI